MYYIDLYKIIYSENCKVAEIEIEFYQKRYI